MNTAAAIENVAELAIFS